VTALVGGDDWVREVHRVNDFRAEQYTQSRIGNIRGPGDSGKFAAAIFEHGTARPVDDYAAPQLHTSCRYHVHTIATTLLAP
jgi:hypothetical protein